MQEICVNSLEEFKELVRERLADGVVFSLNLSEKAGGNDAED